MSEGDRPDVDADALARRSFLKRMAAALALAGTGIGAGGCRRAPSGKILPYAAEAPELQPGNPKVYASAIAIDGYAQGVLVASREGRPIKIEGNPDHPATLGAAGPLEQAHVLDLYDPDRLQAVQLRGEPSTWVDAARAMSNGPWRARRGKGLALVLEPTGSASVQAMIARLRAAFPLADVRWFSAAPRAPAWSATRAAFGRVLEPRHHFAKADVVLVLDDDPFARGPSWMRSARHFADRRRSPADGMSRVYVVEPRLTPTGASGDHRLAVKRSEIGAIAAAIYAEIAQASLAPGSASPAVSTRARGDEAQRRFVSAVARDLLAHRGRGVVIAGDAQPADVHVVAHAIDAALGNIGTTKTFGESPLLDAGEPAHDLAPLAAALDAGEIDTLLVLGANVAYAAPYDLRMGERIARARNSLYLGGYADETASACTWAAPLAHVLETWSDERAFDGTRSIVQPLIAPFHGGRTIAQALAALIDGEAEHDDYALTKKAMAPLLEAPFDASWERALARGVVASSATPDVPVAIRWNAVGDATGRIAAARSHDGVELAFDLDCRVHDGRLSNVAWLAELPEPLTSLTWGNALVLGAATAENLGVESEDLVNVNIGDRTLTVPVLVAHGQAENQASLTLGWGRAKALSVGGGWGANAYALRSTDALWSANAEIVRAGRKGALAIAQTEHGLHGREEEIAPRATLAELEQRKRVGRAPESHPVSLYANRAKGARQWGMVVDLNACTGCNACVVACQAENNVATVGFANVRKGRAMHWLRIDAYRAGEGMTTQPMLCQHCEQAPCEYVCPVGATTHSPDGLNEMTYNRCVGTRFCSNNCPYKVRRFNWFELHADEPALLQLSHNPDVTVRARGVMEKCTYCVQRIRRAEIRAKVDGRELRDGDVTTACEQACPTNAIVFGDIADAASRVARLRTDQTRLYAVLDELGTIPRTLYLARVTNANPELGAT
jgi:molybdopterin-containing oxidoreductase family iron-sulfur binding subunit